MENWEPQNEKGCQQFMNSDADSTEQCVRQDISFLFLLSVKKKIVLAASHKILCPHNTTW